ncbi:hypothetical protein EG329_011618 [Mollisiaceae sp. DMI_Dod_QoI]|nr:hypothetical protein EG329_011618 [Helotiales sp. DMI_Dod_QoI]
MVVTVTVEFEYGGGVVVLVDVQVASVHREADVVEELVVEEQEASVQEAEELELVEELVEEQDTSVQDEVVEEDVLVEEEEELDDVEELTVVAHGRWKIVQVDWQPW